MTSSPYNTVCEAAALLMGSTITFRYLPSDIFLLFLFSDVQALYLLQEVKYFSLIDLKQDYASKHVRHASFLSNGEYLLPACIY